MMMLLCGGRGDDGGFALDMISCSMGRDLEDLHAGSMFI